MADMARNESEGPAAKPEGRPKAAPVKSRKRRLRWPLLILGPVVLIVVGIYMYVTGGRWVSTENAYVRAGILSVSTDVSGIVAEVPVHDNQRVEKGQVLFRLDEEPFRIALAQAQAELGLVRTELSALEASYAQKQAEIDAADADVTYAQQEFDRQSSLAERNVAARASLDKARTSLEGAKARLEALRHEAQGIAAQLGGSPETPMEQHPRFLAAQAAVEEAQRKLDHAVARAPMAGVVANVDALQPGASLPAGQAAFSLVVTDAPWVEANPKETDLTYVREGQPAEITIDTYPGVVWHGHVGSISPASSAEFSVLPAQNASGNWVKVVQRIPLRVVVDPDPSLPPLRAGMSAEVEIDTGHHRSLAGLFGLGGDGGTAYAGTVQP